MSPWATPLVLASGSARRRQILEMVGIPIEVDPSEADEWFPAGLPAEQAVAMLARRKADDVAARHPGRSILAADTLVRVDGRLLGKPGGRPEAAGMLRLMSGRWHEVLTGVALISSGAAWEGTAVTRVRMVDLTPAEIERYVAGPEPYDKAGGYAIQGIAGWFVGEIQGSYSNVMGLPLEMVRHLLAEAGLPLPSLGG